MLHDLDNSRCKEMGISDGSRSMRYHQCYNKPWKDGYCKIHHPDTVAARRKKSDEQYAIKQKQSPWYLLSEAQKRIAELELGIKKLNKIIQDHGQAITMDTLNKSTQREFLSEDGNRDGDNGR